MATTEIYPLASIPPLVLQKGVNRDDVNPGEIVSNWLAALDKCPKNGLATDLSHLFIEECWWRDFVGLSWNFSTKYGLDNVAEYFRSSSTGFCGLEPITSGGLQPALVDMDGAIFIYGGFTFKTKDGSGKGIVRLINVAQSQWKAWMIFTQLERLNSQDEIDEKRHRQGHSQDQLHNGLNGEKKHDAPVLIVGAGQTGLNVAAQLKHMGVDVLLIDKVPRLGDTWRNRYKTVRTHTPNHIDHYSFLKYPSNWPAYLEREKVSDWQEHYATIMGLDIMLGTTVTKVEYDEKSRQYTVEAESAEGKHFFHPNQLVLATGVFSPKPLMPEIPGQDVFKGQVYHAAQHKSAHNVPDLSNKRVAIIGSGTTAHDLAQDFANSGAKEVSMIQRSAIFSFSPQALEKTFLSFWDMPGVSTEEADLMANSFPTAVGRTMSIGQTEMMREIDKDALVGLEKAGMKVKRASEVGYGFADQLLIKLGQFYLNQGAWQMITDGRIKVHACEAGVAEFASDGVVLKNGNKVAADVVIFATGWQHCSLTVEELMGKKVANIVGTVMNFDEEQERIALWRPTGYPGFWFCNGGFLWARQFSPLLALQIKAVEEGLNPQYWEEQESYRRTVPQKA